MFHVTTNCQSPFVKLWRTDQVSHHQSTLMPSQHYIITFFPFSFFPFSPSSPSPIKTTTTITLSPPPIVLLIVITAPSNPFSFSFFPFFPSWYKVVGKGKNLKWKYGFDDENITNLEKKIEVKKNRSKTRILFLLLVVRRIKSQTSNQ